MIAWCQSDTKPLPESAMMTKIYDAMMQYWIFNLLDLRDVALIQNV